MQQQTELVGLKTVARRTVGFQVEFVIFDIALGRAAVAVDLTIEHRSAGLLQVGHHKAGVDSLLGYFHFDHYAGLIAAASVLQQLSSI